MPSLDVGGLVVGNVEREAVLYMKSPGVFAGKPFFDTIFRLLNCRVEWHAQAAEGVYLKAGIEGAAAAAAEALLNQKSSSPKGAAAAIAALSPKGSSPKGTTSPKGLAIAAPPFTSAADNTNATSNTNNNNKLALATVRGPIHAILQGERTALNTLSRCSGVATVAQQAVRVARDVANWKGWVAGTRKTTPGFRLVEKYGLLVGGAATHRLDLSQMVMLKDNHVQSCAGSIRSAVTLARQAAGFSQKIEVECQTLAQAVEAAHAGADIVMLDNMAPAELKEHAAYLKKLYPNVLIEASGGITMENMVEYLSEHVDIVSQGALTQGYPCIDYSLKVLPPPSTSKKHHHT